MLGEGCIAEQLGACLDSVVESAQDFTDSAYTSDARRRNIVRHCDRCRAELARLAVCLEVEAARGAIDEVGAQLLLGGHPTQHPSFCREIPATARCWTSRRRSAPTPWKTPPGIDAQ